MSDPDLYTDIVLYSVYATLLLAVGTTLWSALKTVRGHRFQRRDRIALGVFALLVATLGSTWLLASTQPLMVDGQLFTDTFWLRAADMFIFTTLILTVLCFVAIITARFLR